MGIAGRPETGSVWGFEIGSDEAVERATRRVAALASRLFEDLEAATGHHHTLHELRDTCISELLIRGVPEPIMKAFVGHMPATGVSNRYAHIDAARMRPALHAIDLREPSTS